MGEQQTYVLGLWAYAGFHGNPLQVGFESGLTKADQPAQRISFN